MTKYLDQVFEGRWKVVDYNRPTYTLENIYNHNILKLHRASFSRVVKGTSSISKIMAFRMGAKDDLSKHLTKAQRICIYNERTKL